MLTEDTASMKQA